MPAQQTSAPADGREHTGPVAPVPVAARDPELGIKGGVKRTPSRASLPRSMHSQRTGTADGEADDDDEDNESEYPWGPSHPCFPHPNPHVPLDSALYDSTRIIRIKRDWEIKGDMAPTFENLWPESLDGLIPEESFREIIQKINNALVDAFNPLGFRAWLDAIMGVATFWLWDDAGMTKVKKDLRQLEQWIDEWNVKVGERDGVAIIPLRRTGYLTLDIQIPNIDFEPNVSRPNTDSQQDDYATPQRQSQHGEYHPFSMPPPTLQVNPGSPVSTDA